MTVVKGCAAGGTSINVEVVIEVSRGSFAKRDEHGAIEFLAPLPCPFNYGAVPALRSGDGDRLDAVVLGARLAAGTRCTLPVQAAIHFIDAGVVDDKLICAAAPPGPALRVAIIGFFRFYAVAKYLLNRWHGHRGRTACQGWVDPQTAVAAAERR